MRDPLARLAHITALNIAAVQARIQRTEEHMATICADGYPTGGEGGDGQLTAVEAATLARWRVERDHAEIMRALQRMIDLAGRVLNICDDYPGVDTLPGVKDRQFVKGAREQQDWQCHGGATAADPGGLEWGSPECSNYVGAQTRTGLCDACRKRRQRWRRDHGLAEDDVA